MAVVAEECRAMGTIEMSLRHPMPLTLNLAAVFCGRWYVAMPYGTTPWEFLMIACAIIALITAIIVRITKYRTNFIERPAYDMAIMTPCACCAIGTIIVSVLNVPA